MTVMKERAIDMIRHMPEDKLYYVVQILESVEGLSENIIKRQKTSEQKVPKDLPIGILSNYADPRKRLLEEGAFERAMVEKHDNG